MKKFLEIIKNKWLIKGTTTLLLVLIVIACYIGLNMLVEKVNVENLDFTEKKLYSLSDETKTKLSDLNQDVTIQLINATNYRYLIDYAKKYTILNDRIKVEEISDLSSRVDLKTKYNLSDTDMLIVIKEGEKEKTLTSNDLSTYDYSTNKQIDLTEEAITNAIVELSMDKKPVIYVLSSKSYYQSEQALSSVTQKLQDESNEVKYLDILTSGSVPEDCNCLVITTLKEDLNELERDKILEYIKNDYWYKQGHKSKNYILSNEIISEYFKKKDYIGLQRKISEYVQQYDIKKACEQYFVTIEEDFRYRVGRDDYYSCCEVGKIEKYSTDTYIQKILPKYGKCLYEDKGYMAADKMAIDTTGYKEEASIKQIQIRNNALKYYNPICHEHELYEEILSDYISEQKENEYLLEKLFHYNTLVNYGKSYFSHDDLEKVRMDFMSFASYIL